MERGEGEVRPTEPPGSPDDDPDHLSQPALAIREPEPDPEADEGPDLPTISTQAAVQSAFLIVILQLEQV